jgi:2-polyprenyl-3-methyl-5-hydroxy-6-metoxy-1,4-benzoquinol methylase
MATLSRFMGDRVLEAGSGIGNLTELLTNHQRVVGVDMDASYVARLRERHADPEKFAFYQTDLHDLDQLPELKQERLDTIICVNVLEHVRDDELVLQHFANLLENDGRAIILVPAHPWLYSEVDRKLGHYRRYVRTELSDKMTTAGFQLEQLFPFNRLGTLGWYVSGKLMRADTLSARQMRSYDSVLPLAKLLERCTWLPGLSLVAVGRKTD